MQFPHVRQRIVRQQRIIRLLIDFSIAAGLFQVSREDLYTVISRRLLCRSRQMIAMSCHHDLTTSRMAYMIPA